MVSEPYRPRPAAVDVFHGGDTDSDVMGRAWSTGGHDELPCKGRRRQSAPWRRARLDRRRMATGSAG